jgi:hypothetical protein
LADGVVLSAFPVRKPSERAIKETKRRIDKDNVCRETGINSKEFSNIDNENRFRFQGLIAAALNTRRALREMVLPEIAALIAEIALLREQLGRIESKIENRAPDSNDA